MEDPLTDSGSLATAEPTPTLGTDASSTGRAPTEPAQGPQAKAPGATFETLAICGFIFGIFAMVVATFAVGLAARAVSEAKGGGGSSTAGGAASADVALEDFKIAPAEVRVAAGAVLHLTNKGAVPHDLAVDSLVSDMLDPGATGDLDLTGLAPGTYTMICQVPGHTEAGMVGTVIVT